MPVIRRCNVCMKSGRDASAEVKVALLKAGGKLMLSRREAYAMWAAANEAADADALPPLPG